MKFSEKHHKKTNGFSLIEAIVGAALVVTVFVAILGVFNSGIKLVGRSKAKAGALALANEQMENIRNLPYGDIGTVGGIPPGDISQTSTTSLNGIEYIRRTFIQYVDDLKDGQGGNDENGITSDYKRVKTEMTWPGASGPLALISDIMPKGIETTAGGGTLIINIFDTAAQPVSLAKIHIENSLIIPIVSLDVFTNAQGRVVFPGSPSASNYEITATKENYNAAQTYDADAINVSPSPGHLTILEGETTEASFVIDKVSAKAIKTWEPIKNFSWSDPFNDWSKISSFSSTSVGAGLAALAEETPGAYFANGFLISQDIGGIERLNSWNEFSWNDDTPTGTDIKYYLMRYQGSDLALVPDADLPGNSSGFQNSPADLSGLSTTTYPTLKLKAELSATAPAVTPSLLDWQISWKAGPFPLPNIAFRMRGEKITGRDASNNPIYKYDEDLTTDSGSQIQINNLEFDLYDITVDSSAIGYDISEICPFQPANILPNTSNATNFYLVDDASHTLLINVKDALENTLTGASVHLYAAGYDNTATSSACGQSFFSPLSPVEYNVDVSKSGYETANLTVSVAGQTRLEIKLNAI